MINYFSIPMIIVVFFILGCGVPWLMALGDNPGRRSGGGVIDKVMLLLMLFLAGQFIMNW